MSQTVLEQLRASAPFSVATLPDGLASAQGHAVPGRLVVSPVTGIKVIGYKLDVLVRYVEGDEERLTFSALEDFFVQDSSGRARVLARDATLFLEEQYSSGDQQLGSVAFPVLRLVAGRSPGRAVAQFSWKEAFLEAGEEVFVCGRVDHEVDPALQSLGYRENARQPVFHRTSDLLIVADAHLERLLPRLTARERSEGLMPEGHRS